MAILYTRIIQTYFYGLTMEEKNLKIEWPKYMLRPEIIVRNLGK
jgi:hypothetical protein